MNSNDRDEFLNGCRDLKIELDEGQLEQIDLYVELLVKWQEKFNLVGPDTVKYVYSRHILDSLQIAPFINSDNDVLDIGSGAGLPAVIVCVVTKAKVTACERNWKKVQFLNEVRRKLKLGDSFVVEQEDVYGLDSSKKYDVITSRAFSALENILKAGVRVLASDGKYVLHKGATVGEELNNIKNSFSMTIDIKDSITFTGGKILILK